MKKLIIIIALFLYCNNHVHAQVVVTLEQYGEYKMNDKKGAPDEIDYIKDVNNVLGKYVGTWKGVYNNLNYEIRFMKYTDHSILDIDMLLMRYKITKNGVVVEDTTTLPDEASGIIKGDYLQKNTYVLNYMGKELHCGQMGNIYIGLVNKTDLTKIKLFLVPTSEMIVTNLCPNGIVAPVFPETSFVLTKQ
ncbi:DUF6705 family protein [Flavobacterium sp. FlaQc-52]|jgi:hypothetical protein|uniref:DUF6705 family protein n=1 Tax=Flavobacterium sp. FlaQc-52 TaxID=3374185 RepID=UPI003757D827